ncbi:hypothetical protein [Streptomyces zaomyceticus]|uniref:hypothetical protein n=1 Tax=Streptomyces zaomyceticus TaxID=68286 RepID=UPI0037A83FCA
MSTDDRDGTLLPFPHVSLPPSFDAAGGASPETAGPGEDDAGLMIPVGSWPALPDVSDMAPPLHMSVAGVPEPEDGDTGDEGGFVPPPPADPDNPRVRDAAVMGMAVLAAVGVACAQGVWQLAQGARARAEHGKAVADQARTAADKAADQAAGRRVQPGPEYGRGQKAGGGGGRSSGGGGTTGGGSGGGGKSGGGGGGSKVPASLRSNSPSPAPGKGPDSASGARSGGITPKGQGNGSKSPSGPQKGSGSGSGSSGSSGSSGGFGGGKGAAGKDSKAKGGGWKASAVGPVAQENAKARNQRKAAKQNADLADRTKDRDLVRDNKQRAAKDARKAEKDKAREKDADPAKTDKKGSEDKAPKSKDKDKAKDGKGPDETSKPDETAKTEKDPKPEEAKEPDPETSKEPEPEGEAEEKPDADGEKVDLTKKPKKPKKPEEPEEAAKAEPAEPKPLFDPDAPVTGALKPDDGLEKGKAAWKDKGGTVNAPKAEPKAEEATGPAGPSGTDTTAPTAPPAGETNPPDWDTTAPPPPFSMPGMDGMRPPPAYTEAEYTVETEILRPPAEPPRVAVAALPAADEAPATSTPSPEPPPAAPAVPPQRGARFVSAPARRPDTQYRDAELTIYDVIDADVDMAEEITAGVDEAIKASEGCDRLITKLEALHAKILDLGVPGVLEGMVLRLMEKTGEVKSKADAIAAALPRAAESISTAGSNAEARHRPLADAVKDAGHMRPAERDYHVE